MSRKKHKHPIAANSAAVLFAALGDETRLGLVTQLGRGDPASIVELTNGMRISRQAVSKHLRVLERAGIVRSLRQGRETHFALDPRPVLSLRSYLKGVSNDWDDALSRLKGFVEDGAGESELN